MCYAPRLEALGVLVALLLVGGATAPVAAQAFAFVHPGLLHSTADLTRMKNAVSARQEPIYGGFLRLMAHEDSQLAYRMQGPLAAVGRASGGAGGQGVYDRDATAAYHFALLWAITGDQAYADRAREILDAWSSTLQTINGRDAVLMAGLGPFKMVNAAEILRHTDSGWTQAQARQAQKCFREAVYPAIKDFALFANGNWDTAAMKTMLAIGVYCDDRAIFENAMRYYVDGAGNGRLTHYIINDAGQCQESGRDAAHSQLGIGHLGDFAEIAWNQGLDLYAYADNRLLKGFEYAARYHMGDGDVPFTPTLDRTGKYPHTRIAPRGPGRPIYEQIYGHYVSRMGIASPALEAAVHRLRPEGPSGPIGDHPGFGTLLFARTPSSRPGNQVPALAAPASPAGLVAMGSAAQVDLTWVASHGATSYSVKRAATRGGPYVTLATDIPTPSYSDTSVRPGATCFYVVCASNPRGQSADSFETGITAGMPRPWNNQDIGAVELKGWARFDGRMFTVDGAGRDIGPPSDDPAGGADEFHFVYLPLQGDGTITARFVPQMNSARSKFGLMMREELTADSPHVSLLVASGAGGLESPGYGAFLVNRPAAGAATNVFARHDIPPPFVSEGRFMEPYWFRLTRFGNRFSAFVSADGQRWTQLGTNPAAAGNVNTGVLQLALKRDLYVGLPVCSRILQTVGDRKIAVDTVIRMDNVSVTGWTAPPPPGAL